MRPDCNETQIMDWVKRHDEYHAVKAPGCCHSAAKEYRVAGLGNTGTTT
jgi:hypothetical protein